MARVDTPAPLIVIVGSTATGKSELAVAVAQKYDAEIVSADSWLIRREVNIGSAKPSPTILRKIPHHMIDCMSPCADYSAAQYKKEAGLVIKSIFAKGKIPLIVGGTGLYVDALLYDYSFMPAADRKTRASLNRMTLNELHELAKNRGLDMLSVDSRNKRRVIRLIETNGMVASKSRLRRNTLIIGLASDRDQLRQAIADRVGQMLNAGLENEVFFLKQKYGWDCEALKGIGYSEWRLYFEGTQTIETVRERIIKDTFQLAKRQQTWFKRNKSIQWFNTPVKLTDLDELVTTFLNKSNFI